MKKLQTYLMVILALASGVTSYAQCYPQLMTDSAEIIFDGKVNKFTRDGHLMYAGGLFNTVGRYTGSFVGVDPQSGKGDNLFLWPKVKGLVHGAVPDGLGNTVIFGAFTKVGNATRSSLAMISAAGILTSFQATINGSVNAAVIHNGILYIGGDFTTVNGQPRNRLAALNMSTGVLTSWNPDITTVDPLPCHVACMNADNGTLYIGGSFSHVGTTSRKNIAAINLSTGLATAWAPEAYFATAPNFGIVKRMLRVNTTLYICGQFDYTGGGSHPEVAALDIATGVSSSWSPNPNSAVYALASSGDTVYIGGVFSQAGGQPRQGFAAYSRSIGSLLPIVINTAKKLSDRISAIEVKDNNIYLGGIFDSIGGHFRKNIASFNRFTGAAQSFVSHTNGEVNCMMQNNGKLYIGGRFFSVNMKERRSLAQLDLDADTITTWRADVDGEVKAIAISSKRLYIGGYFNKVEDSVRGNTAAIDVNTQRILNWNPKADSIVNDIICYKEQVYIGGYFKQASGQPRNGIARIDTPGTLHPWTGYVANKLMINTLAVYGDTLFFGGINATTASGAIGSANLTAGTARLWNTADLVEAYVIRVQAGRLYIGGNFLVSPKSTLPATPTDVIGTCDLAGSPISWGFVSEPPPNPMLPGRVMIFSGSVRDIAFSQYTGLSGMFVAGDFDVVDNQNHRKGCIIQRGLNPFYDPGIVGQTVNTMCFFGNKMYYGGLISDLQAGYSNAAFFHLPYYIVDADMTADTTTVCAGQKSTIRVNSSVTYGAVYQWKVNGLDIVNPLPYYTFPPNHKDSVYCVVSVPATGCLPAWQDTTNGIKYTALPVVTPTITISGPADADTGALITIKASVTSAAMGYTIEWFNKGVSIGKTYDDSITFKKGPGADSIYAVVTPRADLPCSVTDTSGLITIAEAVGIWSLHGNNKIQVYPNPFGACIYISGLAEGNAMTIYDITGRKILSAIISSSQNYTLQTGNTPSGTYVLKITNRQGVMLKTVLMQKE